MSNTNANAKVFVSVTMSLDGFIAPESRYDDVGDKRFFAQWGELQKFVAEQKVFRELIGQPGGETGSDNEYLKGVFGRTGVTIIGKRMFDGGEPYWVESAPYRSPVFVLTRQKRPPLVPKKQDGTTFYFVNDGIESALKQAREVVPAGKDIRIGGGAHTIREYLEAGFVDELHLSVAPMLMGRGISLFNGLDTSKIALEVQPPTPSPLVTHLHYKVRRK